ncbi:MULTISPECIES: hypothetical protein [Pseudomonas]|uniref:hypothetical protein n=1 Tax=Pseudomonas TaxID=286 RepID=UPI001B319841|nr:MULTISPECIES: hypothetical protein [Pseudomonas]MBP5957223.1 hypothetical protein [Pseudomonas anatoliensis]MBZ9561636.1 hypothetical protein [Pseudomonas sp. P116]
MTNSQLLLILASLSVCQVIAMALPYWMGWRSGQTIAAASLQNENQRLRAELSSALAQIRQIKQGVSYA